MLGKKSSVKSAKKRLLYSHEYRGQQMGEKNARSKFSRNTRIVRGKNVGKKSSIKSATNGFLYSHEYRDQKMGGRNGRNNLSRNTRIVQATNVGKKIVCKKCEKTFFIFTRISCPKKGDNEMCQTIFSETHE